jgi:hypothetical protein
MATLDLANSHIANLISAGADAMTNMFEVEFYPPNRVNGSILKIRTKGFTPPAPTQKKYDVHWKTVSIPRPATKIELDRSLEFEIRIDSEYAVYEMLLDWQSETSAAAAGFAANGVSNLGKIVVKALKTAIEDPSDTGALGDLPANSVDTLTWVFEDVWIEGITPPTYDTEDANAATCTAKFAYGKYSDPQTDRL